MSYMTKEEFIAAVGGYEFILSAAKEFAKEYREKFVGGKYATIEDIDIGCDGITGDIEITYDVSYCGCCPGEWEGYNVPISYLWDDDWVGREKERRDQQRKIREAEEAKRHEEERKRQEERRYQQYLKMKEFYEGKENENNMG